MSEIKCVKLGSYNEPKSKEGFFLGDLSILVKGKKIHSAQFKQYELSYNEYGNLIEVILSVDYVDLGKIIDLKRFTRGSPYFSHYYIVMDFFLDNKVLRTGVKMRLDPTIHTDLYNDRYYLKLVEVTS